jgi:hypothetical protein
MAKYTSYDYSGEDEESIVATNKMTLFALHGNKLVRLECGDEIYGANPEGAETDLSENLTCLAFFNSLRFLESPMP